MLTVGIERFIFIRGVRENMNMLKIFRSYDTIYLRNELMYLWRLDL